MSPHPNLPSLRPLFMCIPACLHPVCIGSDVYCTLRIVYGMHCTLHVCTMHTMHHAQCTVVHMVEILHTASVHTGCTATSSHRGSASSSGGNGKAPATSSQRASASRLGANGKAPAPEVNPRLNPELPFNRFKAGEGVLISHQAAQTVRSPNTDDEYLSALSSVGVSCQLLVHTLVCKIAGAAKNKHLRC